jgi:hypothetical protein
MSLKEPARSRTPAGVTQSLKRWTNTEVDLPWVSMTGPNRRPGFIKGGKLALVLVSTTHSVVANLR